MGHFATGARTLLGALIGMSLAVSAAAQSPAQIPPQTPPLGQSEESGTGRVEYNDYYMRDQSPPMRVLLDDVELYHLGPDNFWKEWKMKAYPYAQNDLLYTLRKFPNHPRALHMLGELGKATQDYGLPIVHFEKAIKLFPQYAYTHAQYGEYLVEIGAVKAGISELNDAIRIDPNLVLAQAWLDKAYERIGARNRTTSSPP